MEFRTMFRMSCTFSGVLLMLVIGVGTYYANRYHRQQQIQKIARETPDIALTKSRAAIRFKKWAKSVPKAVSAVDKKYGKMIERVAKIQKVDPKLIKTIVVVESSAKEDAISAKNAIGLMGIKPIAARDVGHDRISLLTNPTYSIVTGAKYIKMLRDRYGFKNRNQLLLAYNEGPAEAKALLSRGFNPAGHEYVIKTNYVLASLQ